MKKTGVIIPIIATVLVAAIAAGVILLRMNTPVATDPYTPAANSSAQPQTEALTEAPTDPPTEAPTMPPSYMIEGVEVIPQVEFKAGCETYACTMLLQTLGFDMDEHLFLDKYLEIHWVSYGDDGNRYGPDMYSAQTGDIYGGWGVYCYAMAKYMNHYLSDVGSDKTATAMEGVPLPELCEKYVSKGIPVMVWATTYMMESYPKDSWIVDYVDENAKTQIGDTFTWLQNEHCLVLIGYDEENYYFADSCAGTIAEYERELTETRYKEIGEQSIVVM